MVGLPEGVAVAQLNVAHHLQIGPMMLTFKRKERIGPHLALASVVRVLHKNHKQINHRSFVKLAEERYRDHLRSSSWIRMLRVIPLLGWPSQNNWR